MRCRIPAWLFYDFQGIDPLAARILEISGPQHRTRRWFYFVPARGAAVKLVHRIEPEALEDLSGETLFYSGKSELEEMLKEIVQSISRVAMQYSPNNAVPSISRVDAGAVELVRSLGVEVVSSGDLIQILQATLTEKQLQSHREAARFLYKCAEETFKEIGISLARKETTTELTVQAAILRKFRKQKVLFDSLPIVAVDHHTANPHYSPTPRTNVPFRKGSFVLLDLWCKKDQASSVYADITWVGYVGAEVPEKIQSIFRVVREARDKAIDFVRGRVLSGHPVFGYEVDDKARHFISSKGFAENFTHRTGHSIGAEVHWIGANLDNFETEDNRQILPKCCFSIEPGIYLKEFGVRSEVDVYVDERHVEVNPPQIQQEVVLISPANQRKKR